jgi:hypothetical protein
MRAMTPGRRFKTREAQTLVTAVVTPAEVTRAVAILVAAILVVVIRAAAIRAAVTDLMEGAVIADGTRRVTKGWSS